MTGPASFAFLDQALWKQFREADSPEDFTRAWLALQCRFIEGAVAGVVVLGEPDTGPFAPAASWPENDVISPGLTAAAERAMSERQGVVLGQADAASGAASSVAYPVIIADQLYGVVAVSLDCDQDEIRNVMRQLQWGCAWLEVLVRRQQDLNDDAQRERTSLAFDMVATVLEHDRFQDACNAVVTDLALRLECDPVSIGFVRRGRITVKAVSHAAQFGQRMNLIRSIAGAMDEAVDQKAVVLYPAREDWEYRVTRSHAELASSHQIGSVLTVPLHSSGQVFGALTFERPPGMDFDEATVDLCDAVGSVIGPILDEKRHNDRLVLWKVGESVWQQLKRLFGPHHFGRKLVTAIASLLIVFFLFVTGNYRVTSPAVLEGLVQRTIVAPFDGYVAAQYARAGEQVKDNQVLAELDDKDLALERIRWSTKRHQRLSEYDRALARQERAEANIIRTQVEQAEAQIALLDEQLSRTKIRTPFAGVVVSGDLSQSVGVALKRGEELFTVAPLNEHRIILEVDESDIEDIRISQTGILRVTSFPEASHAFTVERITPVSEQAEGRNFFRVEAKLHQASKRLRPGMEGIAKTEIEDRLLVRIWTEKMVDWIRLTLWKWLP
ncbi:MAG: HlyD family efflux transporter periplasmic adaptor subunit [Pseudomonadota bacterium]